MGGIDEFRRCGVSLSCIERGRSLSIEVLRPKLCPLLHAYRLYLSHGEGRMGW